LAKITVYRGGLEVYQPRWIPAQKKLYIIITIYLLS